MKVKTLEDIQPEQLGQGVRLRQVISGQDGADNFYMRVFDVDADAKGPPLHKHPYEHEMYIISGRGVLVGENGAIPFKAGDAIFIRPNEEHQLIQEGSLRFICLIPADKSGDPVKPVCCAM
ncbi:MAG: cupin domain-containing protein [Syntrophales bacterium]|jgi:quercetin dioxygenase-like cupin family protein